MSKAPIQLSELQLALLRVLWERGEASAAEVHAAVAPERSLAPTTVSTLLSRLVKYGLVEQRKQGRMFLFRAALSEADARERMTRELTERVFDGDLASLFQQLLGSGDVKPGDLNRIKALIAAREEELGGE